MIITKTFRLHQPAAIKSKVLNWLQQFNTFCFLDSNNYKHQGKNHDVLVGAGDKRKFESNESHALEELQHFINEKPSWLFGHLSYDVQTTGHCKPIKRQDQLHFPDTFFFEPEIVLRINSGELSITSVQPDQIFEEIEKTNVLQKTEAVENILIHNKITREEYIHIIQQLQQHIQRGDCYEINFCQEFFAERVFANPFILYERLNALSPNPFSALYRFNDKWLVSASPERFLQKKDRRLISQPMKGTLPRHAKNSNDIEQEQKQLLGSVKEKAENVMVVDLVRNDLSRICKSGSVKVDELFGVYSFPQVHQMVSTISGVLNEDVTFKDIINAMFPMGSMTGAPKINVMQLINRYEKSNRGIFSGTIGYITPGGDFDLNVVIRSLMYNQSTQYLSFQAGSGITIYADAEKEWDECMIKAKAIKEILI